MASLREKLKSKMSQRVEESYSRRESSGRFKQIFLDGIPFPVWKIGSGEHVIDILPYMTGANDPMLPKGEPSYHLEIWVHGKVGPTEDNYVCPSMNYKQPCPICEELRRLEREGSTPKEELDNLKAKRRCVYYVLVHDDDKEFNKGPQLMEISHWFMERHLSALAKNSRTRGGAVTGSRIPFASPDEDGKTIGFEKSGQGMSSQIMGHKFMDRDYKIEDDVLDTLQPLDELVHIPTYEELAAVFSGQGGVEGPETVPGAEEYPQEEAGFEAPEGMDELPVGEDDQAAEGEALDGEDGSEEQAQDQIADEGGCPGGGVIGQDIEKAGFPCGTCPIYDECAQKADELAAEVQAKTAARAATRTAAPAPRAAAPAARTAAAPAPRTAAPAARTAAPAPAARTAAPAPRGAAPAAGRTPLRTPTAAPAGRGPRSGS